MSETIGGNGHGNGKVYVPIGDGKEIPADWAGDMLTKWKAEHPAQFGQYLAEVVTGTKPGARRHA